MVLFNKLQKYLTEQEIEVTDPEEDQDDNEIFGMMVNLVCSLDVDSLDDDQYELLGDILVSFGLIIPDQEEDDGEEDFEEIGLEEAELFEKRIQKIKRSAHRLAHKAYKRQRAKFKMIGKRFRRTAKYKMYIRRHKRMVRAGRTRRKKYI